MRSLLPQIVFEITSDTIKCTPTFTVWEHFKKNLQKKNQLHLSLPPFIIELNPIIRDLIKGIPIITNKQSRRKIRVITGVGLLDHKLLAPLRGI